MQRPWHAHYPASLSPRASYPDCPLWRLPERGDEAKVALIDGDTRLTYGELREEVAGVAGWMRAQGVCPGDRVLMRMGNLVRFVTTYFGVLRAGGVVVAASPELGRAELAAQTADAEPALVVTDDDPPGVAARVDGAHATAVLQYTSGTTGRSKAAVMSHRNLVANALQNARWFGWTADEVNLAVLPLCHTWGMSVCLNSTLAVGGTLVLARRFDAGETCELCRRHGVTVLYGSATMFHRLLDHGETPAPSLRHAKAGAMLTQGRLKERWDALCPHAPLQQGYGLTEASPECHNNPPHRFKPGTVGIPMQDTDCRLVDPADPERMVPPGEAGEVCLKGPQVTSGYWRRPEATAAAFCDGWLRTGDLGVMDADGYLTIVDRLKDMLKFRGYTVSPSAVEDCLLAHPAVAEAVVVGRFDPTDGDVPTAFVVLAAPATDEELAAHCRARLARYEVPRAFVSVDEIPRNHLGKPLRRKLQGR